MATVTKPAFRGAYVDPALTRIVKDQASTAVNPLNPRDLGGTRVYDVEGTVRDVSELEGAPAPPNSPNSWTIGRDPYAVDGQVGQDFYKNQGQV